MMEYARMKTKTRAQHFDSGVTYLVLVSVGLLVLFIVYVLILYRIKGAVVFFREKMETFVSSVPVISTMVSKSSYPPPYEHPPAYHVAVNMERQHI